VGSGSQQTADFVLCSGYIGLECDGCGERLVLLGREEDWRSEGRTEFECECGEKLTLDGDRVGVLAGSPAAPFWGAAPGTSPVGPGRTEPVAPTTPVLADLGGFPRSRRSSQAIRSSSFGYTRKGENVHLEASSRGVTAGVALTENRITVREASRRPRNRRGGTMDPKWFRGQAVGRLRRAKGHAERVNIRRYNGAISSPMARASYALDAGKDAA
jgi:hypothetical protein